MRDADSPEGVLLFQKAIVMQIDLNDIARGRRIVAVAALELALLRRRSVRPARNLFLRLARLLRR